MITTIDRPHYVTATLADGLQWNGGTGLCTEKMDGRFAIKEMLGAVIVGEQMRGQFFAFDVVSIGGDDIQQRPMRERWTALQAFRHQGVQIVPCGVGGEFLEAVLAKGGEGVVLADLDAPYAAHGARVKCKRVETFDVIVAELNGYKASVRVELGGQNCGWVAVRSCFDRLRIGDCIEVAAYGRHASGRFREARFLRARPDKTTRTM